MKKIALLLCLTSMYYGVSQTKKVNEEEIIIKQKKMEYFTIDKYKDWQIDTEWSSSANDKFLKYGNERVRITSYKDNIQIKRSLVSNPYTKTFVYDKKSGILRSYVIQFYQFPIAIGKFYNENGILIKEIDHDRGYTFSLKELIQKIKREHKIDLDDKKEGGAVKRRREENLSKPLYEVYLPSEETLSKTDYLLVDGTTGDVLFETVCYRKDEQSLPPFEQYLIAVKSKEDEDNAHFKTYKGKNYTKKEWKIFEEQWYKNYEENKNRKGFWDDIFNR